MKISRIREAKTTAVTIKSDRLFAALVLFIAALIFLLFPMKSHAVPILQLDVIGGEYLDSTQTIVSYDNEYTVVAYGKASEIDLTETFYLSIAITPKIGPDPVDFGSFVFEGTTYTIDDLVYGVPPLEANLAADGDDLAGHGIFETYFLEYAFNFDSSLTAAKVNTQDTTGTDPADNPGDFLYYMTFDGDIFGLNDGYYIHFDLYNTQARNGDTDVANFAPFSHDAEIVPEPRTVMLLMIGIGLLLTSAFLRKRKPVPLVPLRIQKYRD